MKVKEENIFEATKEQINNIFDDFKIYAKVKDYTVGPQVTRYNITYGPTLSVKSIMNVLGDIEIRLGIESIRFERVVKGQSASGIEIPNRVRKEVLFKDVLEEFSKNTANPFDVPLGKNVDNQVVSISIPSMPHLLMTGNSGSGKTTLLNSIITTLIMRNSPDDLRLLLIDPKRIELSKFKEVPHLLCPIINNVTDAKAALMQLCKEMEGRYELLVDTKCSNIDEYNNEAKDKLPRIIAIIDEYGDIVDACKEVSEPLITLVQKARAAGIYLIVSTSNCGTNVITGVLKANMPTHIALLVNNYVDSMTILGESGAEKLLGAGDMLVQSYQLSRVGLVRVQAPLIVREEILDIVKELKNKYSAKYDSNFVCVKHQETEKPEAPSFEQSEEERYQEVKKWALEQEYVSISLIQRNCSVGFNRAGRYMARLQLEGIVSTKSSGFNGCLVIKK